MTMELAALLFGMWCFGGWSCLTIRDVLDERRREKPTRNIRISGPALPEDRR